MVSLIMTETDTPYLYWRHTQLKSFEIITVFFSPKAPNSHKSFGFEYLLW